MKTKYIIVSDNTGMEQIVIFSQFMNHNDVARGIHGKVISAGFIAISSDNDGPVIICYGRSESLNIDSRPDEDVLIAKEQLDII